MKSFWQSCALAASVSLLPLLGACGDGTNFNKVFTSGADSSLDTWMEKAHARFDAGDFNDAYTYTAKVLSVSSEHEGARVLTANIFMGQAGLDQFGIVTKLVQISDQLSLTAVDSNNILSNIASGLFSITDKELALLATKNAGSTAEEDVYVPKKPGSPDDAESPRASVMVLAQMNKAILILCPIVNEPATSATNEQIGPRNATDDRHDCTSTTKARTRKASAHLIWALSHLIEVLSFNYVLTYTGADGALNLEKRIDAANTKLQSASTSLADLVTTITSTADVVNSVFDFSAGSMMSSTISDLKVIVNSFDAMPGVPKSATKKLREALTQLETLGSKLPSARVEGTDATTAAFRGEITKALAKKVSTGLTTKLKTMCPMDQRSEAEKAQAKAACAQYSTGFLKGVAPEAAAAPAFCDKCAVDSPDASCNQANCEGI